jgi:rSAM/selenodomain-associated transferase 1
VITAVGVMARAPSSPGKTRLAPHLSPSRLTALRAALLADTLHAVAALPSVAMFFTPAEAEEEVAALSGGVFARVPQVAGDLGARMLAAFRYLLQASETMDAQAGRPTPAAAILVGSDVPLLSAQVVLEAAATLDTHGGIIIGPADDGGYYLIGMTRVHPGLFDGIAWGTDSALSDTLRAAERLGVDARLARGAYDVDTIDDLLRLERDLAWAPAQACPAMRRWLSE